MATFVPSSSPAQLKRFATPPRLLERADLAPLAVLVGSLLALFWKVIFTPAMLFYRDVYNYTYPSAHFIHEICRQGFLPYWNPYLNYGQPLLANPNLLFFYPYTLVIVLLPIDLAYSLHYLVHFALGGMGTYLLARQWGQSRAAAFFAGFVFTFSGPVLSLGNLYNHAACAAWIPWALLTTDRAMEGRSLRPWILLTAVFSMQFLAGEPFTLIATFGLSLAYALYRRGRSRPLWGAPNLRILSGFFLVGCLMVALCAVQFLPSADLLSHSRRGLQGLRYRETSNWAVHPLSLVEVVIPDFYGPTLSSPTLWTWLMADRSVPYFPSVFMGFVPLFLALAGWTLGQDRRRNFVAGAAFVMLLLSFGHFTPVFALTYLLVPLLALVRFPVKLLVPVMLFTAILGGWGVDALRQESRRWKAYRNRIVIPLEGVLGCAGVVWTIAWAAPRLITSPIRWALLSSGLKVGDPPQMADYLLTMIRVHFPGLAGFALGGLVCVMGLEREKAWARPGLAAFALLGFIHLALVNYKANPTVPKSFFTYRPPVLSQLKDPAGSYRVTSGARNSPTPADTSDIQTYVNFQSIPEAADLPPLAQGAFQDRLLLATGSMLHGVEGSINLDVERSLPPYLYDLEIYLDHQAPDPLHIDCLLGRTNVKYIIRRRRTDSPSTRLLGEFFNGSVKPSYLYESLCFVPRAYVAGSALFTANSLETLRRLASPTFDAQSQVVLNVESGAAAPGVQGPAPAGRAEIVERHPNTVTLRAELSRPGYVVLMDRYDPNWHATVDGHEVPVLRANQLFRAVYVEAGRHEVRFYYCQRGLRAGLIISVISVIILLLICVKNPRAIGWIKAK